MSPNSANPGRILLFGRDGTLLGIRALVLRTSGLAVDITTDIEEVKKRIADTDPMYGAVICCYTAADAERQEIVAITARLRVTLWQLDCFVPPGDLIVQVSRLLAGH